jgi:RNA polymerase sigma factor (sigma-70 family)
MTPRSLLAPARLAGVALLRSQSDERLVDLVRAGNDAAFEAIVTRYRRLLLRHCSRILSDERAEDVVQQAFVRALAAMRRDERPIDLKPWLYTIAHNATLNALRERSVPSDRLDEEIDGVERPEQAFERREDLRAVVAAMSALPQRQRDALVLRELEGRSYDEIAAELGVTDGAVRQLLNRARTTLRAGVTAVTPMGLLLRVPLGADEPVAERVTELTTAASAGLGTFAAKTAASAVVAGALIGGAAVAPGGGGIDPLPPPARGAVAEAGDEVAEAAAEGEEDAREPRPAAGGGQRGGRGRGGEPARPDDSGRRRSGGDDDEDRSGPSGGDDDFDSSGPGSVGDDSDSSGPGSGGDDDNSGPGGGDRDMLADDNSGSGSSGSGSSGSGSSGSDSSGSGSGSSGSGGDDTGGDDDRSGSNSGSG